MNLDPRDYSNRYENTLVAILFFSWGTVFLDRMSQLYLAPYIAPEFHLTHEPVGMLASVLAITWAVSTLFFGALSDRFDRRRILISAVFAFSLLSWLSDGRRRSRPIIPGGAIPERNRKRPTRRRASATRSRTAPLACSTHASQSAPRTRREKS
jgi:hypothetical protein